MRAADGEGAAGGRVADLLVEAGQAGDEGSYARALELARTARAVAEETGDPIAAARADDVAGVVLTDMSRFAEAIEAHTRAGDGFRVAGMAAEAAEAYRHVGNALQDLGRAEEAIEHHVQAAEALAAGGAGAEAFLAVMNVGNALRDLGRHREAREHLERARAFFERAGEDDLVASCDVNVGIVLANLGLADEALERYQSARRFFEAAGGRRDLADTDFNVANVVAAQGRHEDALDLYAEARAVYVAAGVPAKVADADDAMGVVLSRLGHQETAAALHGRALAVYDRMGLHREAAMAASNEAWALQESRKFDEALEAYDVAVARAELLGEDEVVGHQCARAYALAGLGRVDEARDVLLAGRARFESQGRPAHVAFCDRGLGRVARQAGDREEAERRFAAAARAYRAVGDEAEAIECETEPREQPDDGATAEEEKRPRPLGPRFSSALAWAAEVHRDQPRKGTDIPYVSHLMAVAALVLESGGGEDEAIAALLHDAMEDQGVERTEIERRFGPAVAGTVAACTKTATESDWRKRNARYIAHLLDPSCPDAALLVAAADKLHNARSLLRDHRQLGDALWDRFNGGRDDQEWYYRSLVDAFRRRRPGFLANELARTVEALFGPPGREDVDNEPEPAPGADPGPGGIDG